MSYALQAGGYPDLEFMLRVNQLMIDFVTDSSKTEYVYIHVHDSEYHSGLQLVKKQVGSLMAY